MERKRPPLRLEIRIDKGLATWLFPALLLALGAADLASESLTLSTFYPAPLGVYVSMVTTGAGGTNTTLTRQEGMVGIGTASPGYALDVQANGSNGGGVVNAAGSIQAYGGNAVLWGGTSVYPGNGGPGGLSFYGRPRVGDWGEWLELGEPNSGQIIQIANTGVYTGGSSGIAIPPTLRNTLDDTHGNMYAAGKITAAQSIYAGANFYANLGAGYIHIGDNGSCYGVQGDPGTGGVGAGGACTESNACGCSLSCGANGCYATWTPGIYSEGNSGMFYTNIPSDSPNIEQQGNDASGVESTYWAPLGTNSLTLPQFTYFCCPR